MASVASVGIGDRAYLTFLRTAIAAVKSETFVHGGDDSRTERVRVNRRLIFQFVPVYGIATATPAFLRLALEMLKVETQDS